MAWLVCNHYHYKSPRDKQDQEHDVLSHRLVVAFVLVLYDIDLH